MPEPEKPSLLTQRLGAAACAGWWTLVVGMLIVFVMGFLFLIVVHTPLVRGVAMLWGTQPNVVRMIWIVSVGLLKMALTLWALGCVFLTVWVRKLRRIDAE